MKILILCAFLIMVSAEVPQILQEDGYHYHTPSISFPRPVADIPAGTTTSQLYLPPIVSPTTQIPILPAEQIHHAASIHKPSLVPAKYLPPVSVTRASIQQVQQPTVEVHSLVPKPTYVSINIPESQPTYPSLVPVNNPEPQPTYTPVVSKFDAPIITSRPTIQQSIVVPSPAPVLKYLPPAPIVKVPSAPILPIVETTPQPVATQLEINYQPTPQPQTLQPVFKQEHSSNINVEDQGYIYNNNAQPPFSF